ncbi:MAG: hypothetical protein R2939_21325 [Kofleriaceae bacterium]
MCDIGGGTTDFSLTSRSRTTAATSPHVAVGEHILLGDNMDLALAAL